MIKEAEPVRCPQCDSTDVKEEHYLEYPFSSKLIRLRRYSLYIIGIIFLFVVISGIVMTYLMITGIVPLFADLNPSFKTFLLYIGLLLMITFGLLFLTMWKIKAISIYECKNCGKWFEIKGGYRLHPPKD